MGNSNRLAGLTRKIPKSGDIKYECHETICKTHISPIPSPEGTAHLRLCVQELRYSAIFACSREVEAGIDDLRAKECGILPCKAFD